MPTRKSRHVALSEQRATGLGESVREARKAAGLTQEALAHASGVGTEHIQRIERGVANPTLATIYAIADALECGARGLLPE